MRRRNQERRRLCPPGRPARAEPTLGKITMDVRLTTAAGRGLRKALPSRWLAALVSPFSAGFTVAPLAALLLLPAVACGPKAGEPGQIEVRNGKIVIVIAGSRDSVFAAASRVLVQERIDLRVYLPEQGQLETGFIDLAQYPGFDPEIWDATERLVKLRYTATDLQESTVFICEPLYNPSEVFTGETDYSRLRLVPPGHPGFQIAASLTRRIAAMVEGRAVTSP